MTSAKTDTIVAFAGRWHLEVGDPNAVGWLTAVAYLVVSVLAFRAAAAAQNGANVFRSLNAIESRNQKSLRRMWILVALTMLALGINKQLDLQTLLIQTVRDHARVDGWYNDRRQYQELFIVGVAVLAAAGFAVAAFLLRHVFSRVLVAMAGLSLLTLFVAIRATSFHYVDKVLALGDTVRVNAVLELSGIGLVGAGVLRWQHTQRWHLVEAEARSRADTAGLSGGHPTDQLRLSP